MDEELLSSTVEEAVEYALRRLRGFQDGKPVSECTERAIWSLQCDHGGGILHVSNGEYTYSTAGRSDWEKSGFTVAPATLAEGDRSLTEMKEWAATNGWGLMDEPGPHNHFVAQILTRLMMAEWNRPTAAGLAAAALISRTDYTSPRERHLNRIPGEHWTVEAGWHPWVVEAVLARIVESYAKHKVNFPTTVHG